MPLIPTPALTTLVGVGDPVPSVEGATFRQFGEVLACDGRFVAFWAAWGTETKAVDADARAAGRAVIAEARKSKRPSFIYVNNRLEENALSTIEAMLES